MSVALGAASAVFDPSGRVLLVRHTYGPRNWELPGGGAEDGEDPSSTARRELSEETGLDLGPGRLTGIYYEASGDAGPILHAVFRLDWSPDLPIPTPRSPEIDAAQFWSVERLPRPVSTFTVQRIQDARSDGAAARVVQAREWLPADPTGSSPDVGTPR